MKLIDLDKVKKFRIESPLLFALFILLMSLLSIGGWVMVGVSILSESAILIIKNAPTILKSGHPIGYIFALVWNVSVAGFITYFTYHYITKTKV